MDLQLPPMLAKEFDHRTADTGVDIREHMPYLRGLAASYRAPRIAEFGVRAGNSTCAFLAGLLDGGGHLWSVDIEQPTAPHWFAGLDLWSFLQADALGADAIMWVPPFVDILLVDIDPHSQEQTAAMLAVWLPRVRPGGYALFHDTDWGGGTGVRDALDASGLAWVNREGSNGLGVIEVPA